MDGGLTVRGAMLYLAIKALISGVIIAIVSEIAKRSPGIGALILSLPLISILAFIWLWRDTGTEKGSRHWRNRPFGLYCRPCRCSWCCPRCSVTAPAFGPRSGCPA